MSTGRRKSVLTDQQYLKIRDETPVEAAVKSEFEHANALLQNFVKSDGAIGLYTPKELEGAVFCGHLVADLDSIAGAIGGALLYGGHAARASEMNSETDWALDYWGYDAAQIPMVDGVLAAKGGSKPTVCLVDFQQTTQLHSSIKMDSIVGIIDHHALQNSTVVIPRPVFVDIRPWGSMSTILAHTYATHGVKLPKSVAGLLLSAILSDTLNLRSPTTTDWDKKMVALLVQYCGVDDVNVMCAAQFKAKSKNLASMSAYSLVSGDIKQFKMGPAPTKVAFAVVETTDPEAMLRRAAEFIPEMAVAKKELGVDLIYCAIVDIVKLESHARGPASPRPPPRRARVRGGSPDPAALSLGPPRRHAHADRRQPAAAGHRQIVCVRRARDGRDDDARCAGGVRLHALARGGRALARARALRSRRLRRRRRRRRQLFLHGAARGRAQRQGLWLHRRGALD